MRANLPVSVICVWITNPITIAPMFYFAYRLGAMVLDIPVMALEFQPSFDWLGEIIMQIWQPLLLGSMICAIAFSAVGYALMQIIWRMVVVWKLHKRRQRRH